MVVFAHTFLQLKVWPLIPQKHRKDCNALGFVTFSPVCFGRPLVWMEWLPYEQRGPGGGPLSASSRPSTEPCEVPLALQELTESVPTGKAGCGRLGVWNSVGHGMQSLLGKQQGGERGGLWQEDWRHASPSFAREYPRNDWNREKSFGCHKTSAQALQ